MTDPKPHEPSADRLTWVAHPARERPIAAALTSAAVIVAGVAIGGLAEMAWVGAVAAGVLVLALHRFFLPAEYELDADGLTVTTVMGTQRVRWNEVRLVAVDRRGAWVSVLPRRSWREARRGIHILYGQRQDEILAALRGRLATSDTRVADPAGLLK